MRRDVSNEIESTTVSSNEFSKRTQLHERALLQREFDARLASVISPHKFLIQSTGSLRYLVIRQVRVSLLSPDYPVEIQSD